MKSFAVVENGVVTNVIVAETLEIAEEVTGQQCVEYDDEKVAAIGYTYDPIKDEFVVPSAE
jgi:hypothetical protein